MTKLKSLFAREPVRLAVYTLAAEVARSQVSPTSKV